MRNSADHRFAWPPTSHLNPWWRNIIHRSANRSVALRRIATRRRLARIDPETAERRAMRAAIVQP